MASQAVMSTDSQDNPSFEMEQTSDENADATSTVDLEQALEGLQAKTLTPSQVAIMIRAEVQKQIMEDRLTKNSSTPVESTVRSAVARLTESPTNW
eukprot:COSAG06_NODE_1291_length_9980_cov_166.860237_7_plen_96_part_00